MCTHFFEVADRLPVIRVFCFAEPSLSPDWVTHFTEGFASEYPEAGNCLSGNAGYEGRRCRGPRFNRFLDYWKILFVLQISSE